MSPSVRLRPRRPWTLRTRLLASLLAMLAVVGAVVGLVSILTLRSQLYGQVDHQLSAAGRRSAIGFDQRGPDGRPDGGTSPPPFLTLPGQSTGTIGARIVQGHGAQSGILDGSSNLAALPAGDDQVLMSLPTDGVIRTRSLPGLGTYRLVAAVQSDGDVLVTGLPLGTLRSTVYRQAAVVLGVTLAGLLLAALAGAAIVRVALRPLRRLTETATRVSELPLDRGEVALGVRVEQTEADERTEVGQVAVAFNRMLGHVGSALEARQASETKVRQFVADASHELRTPLASIRGYAELTRQTARDLPPDVVHAIGRVESEARRMTGLVEDLLLLARLDSGRPLEDEPVDLTALVVDAVSDAHATAREHRISLVLPDEPVEVRGDAGRLQQVVTNLLTNAHRHTPPGTAIRVELAPGQGAVRLSVVDAGPGIPAELLPSVFERFARGDSSRSRAAGSTGLGLSIVAAVVASHGGSVTVDSHPGRTAFTVTLPQARRHGASAPSALVPAGRRSD